MWSVEQVTSGRFGSSLPARTSSSLQRVGLELQRQDLDLLIGALAQRLLVGDALREVLAGSVRPGRRRGGAPAAAAGARARARRRRGRRAPAPAGTAAAAAPGLAGAGAAGGRRLARRRGRLRAPALRRRAGRAGGGAPAGLRPVARRRCARRLPARRAAAPAAGIAWITGRMYSRAVWPRLRASLPSLPGTVITRLSPSITTSDPETPRPLTRELMICCAWFSASRVGARSVGRAGGQRDAGAALQVDAELRLGLLVAGQKHQQVHADQQGQEERQVAGRVHRRRRRCHVSLVSSRSVRQHRKGYVAVLSPDCQSLGQAVLVARSVISVAVDSGSSASSIVVVDSSSSARCGPARRASSRW